MNDHLSGLLAGAPLLHLGIVVPDIEAAASAWAQLLGLPVPQIVTNAPVELAEREYRGRRTPARARLALLQLGPLAIELIEPLGGPSMWQDQLSTHGPGPHHLAFEGQDLPAQIAAWAAQGLHMVQRGAFTGGRYAYLDATARLGAVVELLEREQAHAQTARQEA